jgi:cytochrome c553
MGAIMGTGGLRAASVAVLLLASPGESWAGDVAYGQYLASECVTCHQLSGKSDGIPSVVGWPTDSFVAVLNAYRKKERTHEAMQAIAARLSDQDVAALAAYFASIKN